MAETATAVAESSSVEAAVELPKSGTSEYAQWRIDGTIPEKEPKADSTPAPKADADASPAPKQQERTGRPGAKERIQELLTETQRLKAELDAAKAPKTEAPKAQPQYTRPKPTPEDKAQDGKPKYASYEDFVEELSDWKAEQRLVAMDRERQKHTQQRELMAKVEEARTRYDNFDEVLSPTVNSILSNPAISPAVKAMINDSEVLPDLIFTLGSDAKELAAFSKMASENPGKALRYIARVEGLIEEELLLGSEKKQSDQPSTEAIGREANGQFASKSAPTPAKRGPENAPEPPLEVGNRGTGTMDEVGRAFSDIERGNPNAFRAYRDAQNAKELRRRRGA